ncbi:hypothetical protein BC940DRAFT_338203 [Gongronella butleri]|nr:hypothetical protein BC940DRAFT_338203 [Gongronella butleri]
MDSQDSHSSTLSDHTQRIGSLMQHITLQHQKKEQHLLHNQPTSLMLRQYEEHRQRQLQVPRRRSSEAAANASKRSHSPMREAILKGQFLD